MKSLNILHLLPSIVQLNEYVTTRYNRPNIKKIIRMLIALALLPAAQAHDGFMVNSENVLFTSRGDAFFQHFQN